tara:strand:+ start:173 stop:379 length:207 start_codon:yes stop_codon:yes gene_type:complete
MAALSNEEVLGNLKVQLEEVQKQVDSLTTTRLKLLGAIEVLEQIEESKKEDEVPETGTVEVVDNEGGE